MSEVKTLEDLQKLIRDTEEIGTIEARWEAVAAVDPNAGMSSADYLKSRVGQGGDSFTGPGVEVAGAKLDLGFGGNFIERGARKWGGEDSNKIEKRVKKDNKPLFTTNPDGTNRYEEFIAPNLGLLNPFNYFDEGGLVNPEPFYSQKGGFDLSHMEETGTYVQEYMNDEGHRIYVTFIDGVPQMEIPEGYYPVGPSTNLNTIINSSIPTMDGISPQPVQQSSSDRDKPSTPAPTPVNYKELSIDECIPDEEVIGALNDDLNTPKALARIFSLSKLIAKSENKTEIVKSLIGSANLIGLLNFRSNHEKFKKRPSGNSNDIKNLLSERKIARDIKDYEESDRIRDKLIELGVEINDN